jgi:hypothetical protein
LVDENERGLAFCVVAGNSDGVSHTPGVSKHVDYEKQTVYPKFKKPSQARLALDLARQRSTSCDGFRQAILASLCPQNQGKK